MLTRIKKAFTLLELAAVVVILGVLAALASPSYNAMKSAVSSETASSVAETISRQAKAVWEITGGEKDTAINDSGAGVESFDAATNTVTINGESATISSTDFSVSTTPSE